MAATAVAETTKAPHNFSFVAVRWTGPLPMARLRASRDGVEWTEWRQLNGDAHTGASQLISFDPESQYLQMESDAELHIEFIDPGAPPLRKRAPQRFAAGDRPAMVSRLEWGSPDGNNQRAQPSYSNVTHLIVHHTADGPVADAAAWVRAIWRFHVMTNGWADIGYNFLIAPDGTIFEGRAGGDNVIGAHFSCQNSGTMGVALLGDFTKVAPPAVALDALARVLAWRASAWKLDPQGIARHAGMRQDMYVISSHRDGNYSPQSCTVTACPGDTLYPLLEKVRNDVTALMTGRPHWTATPGSLWRAEEEGVWRYGSERTETYETGGRNEGSIEGSPFDCETAFTLEYESWYQTGDTGLERDRKTLEMSVDFGEWRVIDQVSGEMETWLKRTVEMEVQGRIRLRFHFDSVDEFRNAYAGWRLRNVIRM